MLKYLWNKIVLYKVEYFGIISKSAFSKYYALRECIPLKRVNLTLIDRKEVYIYK